jgi:hypothetical protein
MEQITGAISYQYQILRYRHDVATGEFANVGLVLLDPAQRILLVEMVEKYRRLSEFFGSVPGVALLRTLRDLKQDLQKAAARMKIELDFAQPQSVADITNAVLPKDDNALFFSEVFTGWHFESNLAFQELCERLLLRYLEPSTERHDDAYAWKHIYKQYFDHYGVTDKLVTKTVKTPNDNFEFDKACQNGAWHCFQSLSFDLADESRIKAKMYTWAGKIAELQQTDENLKLYLLSALPEDPSLRQLITQKLTVKGEHISVRLVGEREAPEVVEEVKAVLEEHN